MKRRIPFITALLFFAITLHAQDDASESRWQANEIVIDGNSNEWPHPFTFFDNKSGVIFSISNDSKNMYLCFSNNDKAKADKMMKAGWSVALVSTEKKRKFDAVIDFPKSADPDVAIRSDFKTAVVHYKDAMTTVKTKGFLLHNGDVPLNNKDAVNIGIGTDSSSKIVYEIKIPLNELMEEGKAQLNELITLDITVNELEKLPGQKPAATTTTDGGFSGGGGGRGGGRMGGGRGRGGSQASANGYVSPDRYSLYDKISFKQKIKLVSK